MLFAFQTFAFCQRAALLKEAPATGQHQNEKKLKNGILPAAKPIKCRFHYAKSSKNSFIWPFMRYRGTPGKVEINAARQPCVPLEHQGTPGELEINASR